MSETQTQRPNMSRPGPSSSIWLFSYMKLQFFSRIRRILQSKATERNKKPRAKVVTSNKEVEAAIIDDRKNEDVSALLQRSVKRLHFGSWEEKEVGAMEIGKLAKEDVRTRKLMAELGVIPVLVAMVASDQVPSRCRVAIKALKELANGSYTNKAVMVEAGVLSKLPKTIGNSEESTRQEFSELILSLSSLANTEFPLSSSEVLPFVVGILDSSSTLETKEFCLATLYNLSAVLDNTWILVSNGVVETLLRLISVKQLSEKALATLGHLVVTLNGKKAMENSSVVPESLVEILAWEDKPKCQELSAYILMILAHQSSAQRAKMSKSGIVPLLLEVALLGSPLAQKRALKLLQWFQDERQTKMGPHSGPQTRRIVMGSPVNHREAQEGKKMMRSLVKQSLYKNLEMITRRANAGEECSKLKTLVVSTSSKSLPY